MVGHDTQANDHPLATAIGPQRNGPMPAASGSRRYKEWSGGHRLGRGFSRSGNLFTTSSSANGILGIENVGGELDAVTGKRCTFAFFPVELGPRRRLHHPPRRNDRQRPDLSHRTRRGLFST